MANKEQLEILKQGVEAWNQWYKENSATRVDFINAELSGADLASVNFRSVLLGNANLSGANLRNADLADATLAGVNLTKSNLDGAVLVGAVISNADLSGASLVEAKAASVNLNESKLVSACLRRANLRGVTLRSAHLGEADLASAILETADLGRADLAGANLSGANLARANLGGSNLHGANLTRANLTRANLNGADLSEANLKQVMLGGAELSGATFYKTILQKTKLSEIRFELKHPVLHDRSETIQLLWRDKYLNWSWLRAIGRFPLFGVSWTALFASLLTINAIGRLNETKFIADLEYPIPIPHRMMLILLTSVLLVIGTTIYELMCPNRVKEFSETEWVEKYERPRLQYLAEKLKRRGQGAALFFSACGGLLALYLILERLYWAAVYILKGAWVGVG